MLRQYRLEDWVSAITEMGGCESLVLRYNTLMRCCVVMVCSHQISPTVLPTSSRTTKRKLGCCATSLAVLLLPRVVGLISNK